MGMTDTQLLRSYIQSSGLSARRWAKQVARVDERTVRYWLSGERPIPKRIKELLEQATTQEAVKS